MGTRHAAPTFLFFLECQSLENKTNNNKKNNLHFADSWADQVLDKNRYTLMSFGRWKKSTGYTHCDSYASKQVMEMWYISASAFIGLNSSFWRLRGSYSIGSLDPATQGVLKSVDQWRPLIPTLQIVADGPASLAGQICSSKSHSWSPNLKTSPSREFVSS